MRRLGARCTVVLGWGVGLWGLVGCVGVKMGGGQPAPVKALMVEGGELRGIDLENFESGRSSRRFNWSIFRTWKQNPPVPIDVLVCFCQEGMQPKQCEHTLGGLLSLNEKYAQHTEIPKTGNTMWTRCRQ